MYFDRFDIVEAWFVWLNSHHVGIVSSRKDQHYWQSYNRLSMMEKRLGFKPGCGLCENTLSENGKEIYDAICRRAGCCDCLEGSY